MSNQPEFPDGFVLQCCPRVSQSRRQFRQAGIAPNDDDLKQFAECAMVTAGCGMKCENCGAFFAEVAGTEAERKYLPQVREYYKKILALEAGRRVKGPQAETFLRWWNAHGACILPGKDDPKFLLWQCWRAWQAARLPLDRLDAEGELPDRPEWAAPDQPGKGLP